MKLQETLVGIAMFSLVVLILVYGYSDLTSIYGTTDAINSTQMIGKYDKTSNIQEISLQSSGNILNKTITESSSTENAILGASSAARLAFKSPAIIGQLLNQAAADFGIPPYIINTFFIIVIIGITFAFIAMIFNLGSGGNV
jgi:hypothetical protein